MQLSRMTFIANVVLFQVGWFACVLGAAHGLPWLSAVALVAIIGWHLQRAAQPMKELALIAAAAVIGALFDTLLVQAGWVRFDSGVLIEGTSAYWMVALWAIFATTLNVSLRSLRPHLWLSALLGAIGGPVAYYAGVRLGALDFTATAAALTAIAVGWAVLTAVLLGTARRLDGYARS
jgi:hypothetical protein